MNNQTTNLFAHGAKWVRADFHLHTIKEKDSSRKKFRDEWRNADGTYKEDEFAKAFVQKLKSENIRVACITNHDYLDYAEYKNLAKKALEENILILPGIELNTHAGSDGVHTLVIFNPEDLNGADQRIDNFLSGQFPGGKQDGQVTQDVLATCLTKLEQLSTSEKKLDYFIVFAHVESDNGLLKSVRGQNLQQLYRSCESIWKKRVLGFQKVRREDSIIRQILGDIPTPAFVEGSDPSEGIDQIGDVNRGVSYLKISDLSYAAVKFALCDHKLRVTRDLPEESARINLVSLEIQTSGKGTFGHFFSKDLNCLIGSRGSGKSLIIEALRWTLGKEPGTGDDTYKLELLDAFLQKGGKTILHGIDNNGNTVVISRNYLGKREQPAPEVLINGTPSRVSTDVLFPGLLYFGQKDLGMRSEQSDAQLFDQLLGSLPTEISDKIERKLGKLKSSCEKFLTARKAKEADDEYAYELNALNGKLSEFKAKGIEDKLEEITLFDQDLRIFRAFLKEFNTEKIATKRQFETYLGLAERFPTLKSLENTEAAKMIEVARNSFSLLGTAATKINDLIEEVNKGLSSANELLELKQHELQSRFGEILRSVNEPDLDLDGYRKMVSRQKQLNELRTISKQGGDSLATTKRELIAAGDEWISALKEASEYRNEQLSHINQALPEKLNLEIEPLGERDKFDAFLDGMLRGSNFTTQAREAIVSSCSSGFEIFKRWDAIRESEITPAMASKLETVMYEKFVEFLTFASPDGRHITFDGKRINELSLGKRAMALLVLLLSLKNYPIIIIDQPEDDLDNETIHRMIVDPLRDHKGHTQFIIATHNPNIPVLADAEQVIDCHETSKGQYEQNHGSLDKPTTKQAIITIMEGGEKAFERRHEIYSQWTK